MLPRAIRMLGLAAAALPFIFSAGSAQEQERGLRLSAGWGAAVPFETSSPVAGATHGLRFGVDGRVTDWLSAGVEWMGTWFVTEYGNERRYNVGLSATAYPFGGFFVSTGIGYGLASRVTIDGPPEDCCGDVVIGFHELDSGSGLTLSTGFDARITRHWILTPVVSVAYQRVGGETVGFGWFGGRIAFDTR